MTTATEDDGPPASGPVVDPARLAALDRLEILDTAPEEALDRITRLTARCIGAPVALLSLIDHDRQFIKSSSGAAEGLAGVSLTESLCRSAIEAGEALVVDDVRARSAVAGTSSIGAHGAIAYAGAPLVTHDGFAVGALCAIDAAPRQWTGDEIAILTDLAALAVAEIEVRGLRERDRRERQDLERDVATGTSRLRLVNHQLDASRRRLEDAREEAVLRMARTLQQRSEETGAHVERMSGLCEFIARHMGLDADEAARIRLAAMLHDVGKIAVPDAILLKPGALTARERETIERHTWIGHEMLSGSSDPVLDLAATIALTHHERLDGSGYPRGLRGHEIPVEGRIAAVADVFDALTNDRVYRPAMSETDALELMDAGRDVTFDPRALDALIAHHEITLALRQAAATAHDGNVSGGAAAR